MYTPSQLSQICILCLTKSNNKNLVSIVSQDGDGVSVEEKLKYFLVELVNTEPKISTHVCFQCLDNLHKLYKFKQRCVRNITKFNSYLLLSKNIEKSGRNSQATRIESDSEDIFNFKDVIVKRDSEDEQPQQNKNRKTTEVKDVLRGKDNVKTIEHGHNKAQKHQENPVLKNDDVRYEIEEFFIKEEPEDTYGEIDLKEELDTFENETLTNTGTSGDLQEKGKNISLDILPEKSKQRYERCYQFFVKWCEEKNVKIYTEKVLLTYFAELNQKSVWSIFSMLKCCILIHTSIDISQYTQLMVYLKNKCARMVPKRSKILEEHHINSFIDKAPDIEFLLMKVVLIIGVSGGLRREELYKMLMNDFEFRDGIIIITIPETETSKCRQFVITNSKWVALVKKYLQIRLVPSKIKDRFFLKYTKGKCINAPVGINSIGAIPSKIANYLNLDDCRDFTGHCYRRSSAKLFSNGVDGLKTQVYKDNTLKRKSYVSQMMTGPSTSKISYTESSN